MDEKDLKIIELLRENSKLSTQQISKKTLIPVTTVHNRIRKMVSDGTIRKYTIALNHEKMGKFLPACILVNVEKNELKEKNYSYNDLARKIKNLPEVEYSCSVTGVFDLFIRVRVENVAKLNSFLEKLRELKGIKKTQTGIILEEAD